MVMRRKLKDPMEGKQLKSWQIYLIELLKTPCDENDRRIHWFWESNGNVGKSTFTKHLMMTYNAVMVTGKSNDVKFIIAKYVEKKDLDVVIFDVPRVNEGHISYSALEEIKNGCLCSGKYEGCSVLFNKPHVIIFSNQEPANYEYLSADKWHVMNIDN